MLWKIIVCVVLLLLVAVAVVYYFRRRKNYGAYIPKLPLRDLGYENIPAVPFQLGQIPGTLVRLGLRAYATTQAKWGMDHFYTIGAYTANGYTFQYGVGQNAEAEAENARQKLRADLETSAESIELTPAKTKIRLNRNEHPKTDSAEDPLTLLTLTGPEQFAMSLTSFNGVYENAEALLPEMVRTITDANAANRAFWPTIAEHGFAYNLLILQKVDADKAADYKNTLGNAWTADMDTLLNAGRLYAIDLRMYAPLAVNTVKGAPRYTPATLTLLAQNADKTMLPLAVHIIGVEGQKNTTYVYGTCTDGAWLYALMAAKTSISLYGIWMGHVYHWHIVSAAMLMTLANNVEETHPLRVFMAPNSEFLIPFDDTLLLLWKYIAPPTSVSSAEEYIQMTDRFAKGRTYLQDDPDHTLLHNGILPRDFTDQTPWDRYPIAGEMLSIFGAVGDYVTVFVNNTWPSDAAVVEDKQLQAWIAASGNPADGNVAGIPTPDSRAHLIKILRSLVFRLTAHGASRMNSSANPTLSFVPNMPPCLQRADLPDPQKPLGTTELLTYLPKTGTIGEMITFLFTFVFSSPYVPFLPFTGNDTELIWPNGLNDPRNVALVDFRNFMQNFMQAYEQPHQALMYQWPRNIET